MKTVEDIINNSESLFLNDWSNEQEMWNDFSYYGHKTELDKDIKVILASYTYENYSGSAFVLFAKDGKLYEVNGGHCSCYGLEGQWEPEEVNLDELRNRVKFSTYGFDGCKAELEDIIN